MASYRSHGETGIVLVRVILAGWAMAGCAACLSLFTCCNVSAAEPKLPILGRLTAKRPEVLSGTFSGMVVTRFMPRDLVRTWLPSGLQLAKDCPYTEHPVVILFGSIDDLTREKVVTVKPRFGRHYLETFVAVPYLQFEQTPQAKPIFHFVRVYSDSLRGTAQGIRKYGWPKILTPIDTTEGTYRISREGFGPVLAAEMDYTHLKSVESANRSWNRIQEMLSQPLVLKHDGTSTSIRSVSISDRRPAIPFPSTWNFATVSCPRSSPSRCGCRESPIPSSAHSTPNAATRRHLWTPRNNQNGNWSRLSAGRGLRLRSFPACSMARVLRRDDQTVRQTGVRRLLARVALHPDG